MQVKGNCVHELLKYAQRWKRTKQNRTANNFEGVNESIAFARFIKNIYMSDNTTVFEQKSLFTTLHSTGWEKNPRLALNGDFKYDKL